MKLIAGLGNPGTEYKGTRHNVGFEVIDLLAKKLNVEMDREKFSAAFGQVEFEDKKLILLKPLMFMNNSGQVIVAVVNFYKLAAGDVLVITDDMALEPGMLRLRAAGSAGGHNGLSDIIEKLGTDEFGRLRIGIGSRGQATGVDYVLSKPLEGEREQIDKAVSEATDAAMLWVTEGIETVMNKFNRRLTAKDGNGGDE
ncbi:MAG: aminoacyl-tRNA hydrolase [Planctomycetes bacterium RBG_13_44_8b]|nr:MAG: aminoacyl-tRNA hydrolase [Planctomycetes bacterium RBG_13_44_8b]